MLEEIRSIDDLALDNQRVLIRTDFDVPLKDGVVGDDARLRAALSTIQKVQSSGARVILASRLGDPRGRPRSELSLEPVAARLSELLGNEIYLPDDSVGDAARKVVQDLRPGQVCLLENLAFHPEEEASEDGFARKLAGMADVFVNDAPRDLARREASTTLVPRLFRSRGAGHLVVRELTALARMREKIERPFVAVIGGERVLSRFDLIESLIGRVNVALVGGVVGNTLLRARGSKLGGSKVDMDALARGRALLGRARDRGLEIVLPTDLVIGPAFDAGRTGVAPTSAFPDESVALDIGAQTIERFKRTLASARTVLFAGSLGVLENPAGRAGTREVLGALAAGTAFHVLSDPRLLEALEGESFESKFGFVAAGGDASLELLSGRKLPGLEALRGGET